MKLKLFYIPDTQAIVARVKGEFYHLPDCTPMNKPLRFIPCHPFTEKEYMSDTYDITDTRCYEWIHSLSVSDITPDAAGIYIRAGRPRMILRVDYSKNDKGKDALTVSGHLPGYVLNGVARLLTMTFTD